MKGLLLVSGGIDSPVAGYIMQKQGVEVIAIHFDNEQFSSSSTLNRVENLCKKLNFKLINFKYGEYQRKISQHTSARYHCIFCKRTMYRVAEKIALENKCDFLITGENLGQVASQTLENMRALDEAIEMQVLRPLLCYNKDETIRIAKEIGSFDISISEGSKCLAVPPNPATRCKLEAIKKEEQRLEFLNI